MTRVRSTRSEASCNNRKLSVMGVLHSLQYSYSLQPGARKTAATAGANCLVGLDNVRVRYSYLFVVASRQDFPWWYPRFMTLGPPCAKKPMNSRAERLILPYTNRDLATATCWPTLSSSGCDGPERALYCTQLPDSMRGIFC